MSRFKLRLRFVRWSLHKLVGIRELDHNLRLMLLHVETVVDGEIRKKT